MKKVLLIIVSCCISFISCKEKAEDTVIKDRKTDHIEDEVTTVKAILVEKKDFNYELISNGTIGAMQKADLKFQTQEVIKKVYVRNGSWVSKGQIIAELDQFKLKNSLSLSEEAKEKALLELQDVLIGQGYSLKDSANIPQQVMKIAKIRSGYQQSLNNYEMAKYNFEMSTLRAPISGVIANLWSKENNYPVSGEPFCTVLDNRNPEVAFNVLESEIGLVSLNDKVLVSPFSTPDMKIEGRVIEINPTVDKNGMIKVKAMIPNKENRFYEGMNVKVRVQRLLGQRIVIPKSAVVMRTNRKVVFTLKNNQSMWNYVETAQENSDSYVISEGINAGDSVVYEGNINLAHLSRVKLGEVK